VSGGPGAALERLLRRDRLVTAAGLALLCVLAWVYLLNSAGMGMSLRDMTRLALLPDQAIEAPAAMPSMPDMPGMKMDGMDMGQAAAAPAPVVWSAKVWLLSAAMWWTMMVAMMTPAAAPTVLLYARVHRHAQEGSEGLAPTGAFVAGYLLVWLGFSLAAVVAHWGLQRSGLLSTATMGSQSKWLSGGVLIAAGLYQLSPLQGLCLRHCRSPAAFLSRHWRPGVAGAIRLGLLHGAYCVGCCWLLMALLFVGGVMNFVWIAALTLVVMAQKLLPGGAWVARAAGVLSIAWGGATLAV
jgi:predicted metal-binding membrane protein